LRFEVEEPKIHYSLFTIDYKSVWVKPNGLFFRINNMPLKAANVLLIAVLVCLVFISCGKGNGYSPYNPAPPYDPPPANTKRYLALGDSYTVGQSLPKEESFPAQLITTLRVQGYPFSDAEIIATTGWTTGNLLDAIASKTVDKPYDLVSLLIGVNNQYQRRSLEEYRAQFTTLLNKAITFAGNNPAHVIVLSIPDYSVTPYASSADRNEIARQIDSFNAVNVEISVDRKVNYVDITPESRKALNDDTLVAADGLHFSAKEYRIWVDMLLPSVRQILK